MGYRFHKKGDSPFYLRLCDASTLRAAARIECLDGFMPRDAPGDELISPEHRDKLIACFRDQSELLARLATYFEGAEDLKWDH